MTVHRSGQGAVASAIDRVALLLGEGGKYVVLVQKREECRPLPLLEVDVPIADRGIVLVDGHLPFRLDGRCHVFVLARLAGPRSLRRQYIR